MSTENGTRPSAAAYAEAGTAIERVGFGSREIERRRETQATAMAERAKAEVQAMFIVAAQYPRTWETVWGSLTKECNRPSFAEAAMYRLKKGKKKNDATGRWEDNWIEGLTIGFARTAVRMMGNLDVKEAVTYEDSDQQITSVSAIDLECNVRQSRDVTVRKSIERGSSEGRIVLGERRNSYDKTTYIVVPTDEEMEVKVAARVSKTRRTLILDMLPADLKDDCLATIKATRARGDKTDPDAAKKKMIAAYAAIGIDADELVKYLGHPFEQITAAEMEELRGVGAAIKEGETNWPDALRERLGDAATKADAAPAANGEQKPADKTGDALKAKLADAPGKDKTPAKEGNGKKPAGKPWVWQPEDGEGKTRGTNGDLLGVIEKTGPSTFGWWVATAGGDEVASGEAHSKAGAVSKAEGITAPSS